MKENLNIYYDKKGDYLELRISIFNFKKRNKINLKLPLIVKN